MKHAAPVGTLLDTPSERACARFPRNCRTLCADATFFGLQPLGSAADLATLGAVGNFIDAAGALRDFGDTAALIEALDLVITVDCAVAHLAGALGKPVWVLLPFSADWRWLAEREDSPWYTGARLFRQSRPGDWTDVIGRVCGELTAVPAARR